MLGNEGKMVEPECCEYNGRAQDEFAEVGRGWTQHIMHIPSHLVNLLSLNNVLLTDEETKIWQVK
jgi:hypothetical protein